MKKLLLLTMILVGCSRGTGTFTGKVIDVSWEGLFFKTCEVDAQYGEGASKHARFSSESESMCKQIEAGKTIYFKYDQSIMKCFTCGSNDLILEFKNE